MRFDWLVNGVVFNDSSNDEACLFQSHLFKATGQTVSSNAHSLHSTAACDSLCLDWLDYYIKISSVWISFINLSLLVEM